MKKSDEILKNILKEYKTSLKEFNSVLDKNIVMKDKVQHCMNNIDKAMSSKYIWLIRGKKLLEQYVKIVLENKFIINKFINNEIFQNSFETLDGIEMYYKNLEIKTCWGKVLIGINTVRNITLIFNKLHEVYPDIKIKEIGEAQFNGESDKIDPAGEYIPKDMKILFYSNSLDKSYEDTMVHEFGHAIGHQYNINDDNYINSLFENLSEEKIKSEISYQAAQNVREFIAYCFVKSFCYDDNEIVNKVRTRIDEIVKEKDNS